MKLTLKIKLLPDKDQSALLVETIKEANTTCNAISEVAWDKKIFNQFNLHHVVYHSCKATFRLSAQMLIRCISKVADSYKIDKKTQRHFRELGGITYDSRILTYKPDNIISLWAIGGRTKIPFVCHNRKYIPYIKGEADLIYKKGKFYIFQSIEVPEEEIEDIEEFIGVDMGITDIAVTSDGIKHTADWLNTYREHRQFIRSSIQRKGTRNSRKLLKRISGKERTTATIINHTIAKRIVMLAKSEGKGIAVENLTNIRFTSKRKNKKFKTKLGRWNFRQLRTFIAYKAKLNGVKMIVVDPRYTSQTCHVCHHIGKRTNKMFNCTNYNCNVDIIDADQNAAINIALLGAAIDQPEKSSMCCQIHAA
jgi:IS605 OrfB family transposase